MRLYRVDIQEVTERSGLVTGASEGEMRGALEGQGYSLFDEDVQVTKREVVSLVEVPPVGEVYRHSLPTRDDVVAAIQPGAYLVWVDSSQKLEQLGTHYFPERKEPFDRRHPLTVALTDEARVRLARSAHKGAWRLVNASYRSIVLDPVKATAAELEEQFDYPPGYLAHLG